MRKIVTALIVSIFLLSAISVNAENEKEDAVLVEYDFEKPILKKTVINGEIYDRIILKDTPNFGNPGEPLIPMKGAYILLPESTKVKEIKISHDEMVSLGKGFTLEPVGDLATTSQIRIKPSKSDFCKISIIASLNSGTV